MIYGVNVRLDLVIPTLAVNEEEALSNVNDFLCKVDNFFNYYEKAHVKLSVLEE